MNVIRESNQNYLNLLNQNLRNNTPVRFMKYLIIVDVDNGKAILNTLTRAFIWIPNDQWASAFKDENSDIFKWLWNNYFLVNDNFDERSRLDYIRETLKPKCDNPNYLRRGQITEFTIFTTMACNARCFYCYEKGRPQVPMKASTAHKVADYIVSYAAKDGRNIELRWFGGEPLVNENVIDIICKEVQDAGFNYTSEITSNGFLYKADKIDKYHNLWHLKSTQITIDGTEEVYNKTKNYKNIKGASPYQVVCNNIKMLADNNIFVSIRMNLDQYNAENIKELIKELYTKFGNHNHIALYNYPIFEDPEHPRTDEEKEKLYAKLLEADETLAKYGFYRPREHGPELRVTHCMIDNGHAVVIGTQGDIGLCEHYSETEFWSHIDNPTKRDNEIIKKFQEHMPLLDICDDCPIAPNCIRVKMCQDLRNCNIWKREWEVKQATDGTRNMYYNWLGEVMRQNNQPQIQQNDQQENQNNKQEEPKENNFLRKTFNYFFK